MVIVWFSVDFRVCIVVAGLACKIVILHKICNVSWTLDCNPGAGPKGTNGGGPAPEYGDGMSIRCHCFLRRIR
jgi:hypothetical protein